MEDIFDFMINNEYFSMGLIALLVVLIILFFVVLFLGKEKKVKTEIAKETVNNDTNNVVSADNNINFDHGEYVKETTAEFELAPISDVAPTPDGFVPEVQEESPAIKFDSKEEPVLKDFSFDELSKSISDELDKLKVEEQDVEPVKPVVTPVETPVVTPSTSDNAPAFITDAAAIEKEDTMVLPKLAVEEAKKEVIQEKANEPVISDNEVPLFQRFNQETFDINKKD